MIRSCLLPAAAAMLWLAAGPAAARGPDLCHYDAPAPFVAHAEAVSRGERPEPLACAEAVPAQEAPAELILPMPCGQRMHFRRVDLRLANPLEHRSFYVGDANAAARSALNRASATPRAAALSGAFSRRAPVADGAGEARVSYFYVGKYEITAAQWRLFEEGLFERGLDAVGETAPVCRGHLDWVRAETRPVLMLPASAITRFEAEAFARAYTLWLIGLDQALIAEGAQPFLPWQKGSTGFLRLPSDVEWELAARGGPEHAKGETLSRAIYPVRDDGAWRVPDLAEVAQLDGRDPPLVYADGVGKRLANPLGLHDMLGNVEEIVLELFQPTRPDGLMGQLGGVTLRGGSTVTDDALIGVGYRIEAPLYGPQGEVRSPTTGARLAVAAPYFVEGVDETRPYAAGVPNEAQFDAIEAAFAGLKRGTDVGEAADLDGFVARAEAVRLTSEGEALVNEARALIERTVTARATAERDALVERFIAAATLRLGANRTGANVSNALNQIRERLVIGIGTDAERRLWRERWPSFESRIVEREREVDAMVATYVETVVALAGVDEATRDEARSRAVDWVETQDAPALRDAMASLVEHVDAAVDAAGAVTATMKEDWRVAIDDTLGKRRTYLAELREATQ
ncbi:MAG: formylglycine-generating enzyme family protein [Paracoccaceae bacterium]